MKQRHETYRDRPWPVAVALLLLFAGAAFPTLALAADIEATSDESMEGDEAESSGLPGGLEDAFGLDRLFVPRWRLTDGPQVRAAFRDVAHEAREATVCIHCDGKHRALGGIVRADGWIVTKATPLCGNQTVVLADGRKLEATTVGVNGKYDLALLKVEASGLPTLDLSHKDVPEVGSWLASVGRSQDPVAVGIVSVAPREIPPQPGILGVQLDQQLPLVIRVFPESPAEEAGVKPKDRIVQVAGKKTPTRAKLREVVGGFNPGDQVDFTVEREGKQLTLKATLTGEFPGFVDRSEFQNSLGGKLSVRRYGFPTAFQHDTVIRPADCGGPVVDVDGHVVGFNIARAGRTESFALPVAAVQDVVSKLMASKLTVSKPAPDAGRSAAKSAVPSKPAAASAVR